MALIVYLHLQGYSFRKIAARLCRDRLYVSNVFNSTLGQQEVAKYQARCNELARALHEQVVYAAQQALDEIIALATRAESEAVRYKAAECIVSKALDDGKPQGGNVQVKVSEGALRLALNTLEEMNATRNPPDDTDEES